ncbi:MAG: flagellar protein FlaG [Acidobacteria bacterium]|nr:flagellar protein FlaG [Acidobacteriota bacterium]
MANGIDILSPALAHAASVTLGPAARNASPKPKTERAGLAGDQSSNQRTELEKTARQTGWQEEALAGRETLKSLIEYAERAAFARDTTIVYRRDDQNGRMYLHVMDKRTGEELYRIPKDYLPALERAAAESHQLDIEI